MKMRATGLSLMMVAALGLGACGNRQSADHRESPTTPATALAPPASPAAPVETPTQKQEAGLAPTQPGSTAHPNEDGSETVESAASDGGLHNVLLTAVASTMAAGSSSASAAPANLSPPPLWQEGVNYTRMVPAQPTSVPPGQVEVLEFFWYGCPHCYALDPKVEAWRKTKPAYVTFSRVPVMWMEGHRSTARLYYALEDMGKLDQLHSKVFEEIHVNGDPLIAADPNDAAGAERVQATFLQKFGISEDAFKKSSHDFAVETDLQRADQLGLRYKISGVPTFVVNGKYVADVSSAGSPERLIALVTDLAAQEHKP